MSLFPKLELKSVRTVHNGLLTVFNLYLVIEILRQASLTGWYAPIVTGEQGLGVSEFSFPNPKTFY